MRKITVKRFVASILCLSIISSVTFQATAENVASQSVEWFQMGDNFQNQEGGLNEIKVEESTIRLEDLEASTEADCFEIEEAELQLEAVKDSGIRREIVSRAAGTDLAISNLRSTSHTEPFPNMTDIKITSTIQNLGSTTISSFNYSVYVSGQLLTTKNVQVTLNSGVSANLNLNIKNRVGGSQTVLITVWLPDGQTETTTANNSISKEFRWQDAVSIRAYSVEGPSKAEPLVEHEYEIGIANLGNIDATDIPIKIILNGKMLSSTGKAEIPARKVLRLTVNATFQNTGSTNLGISIDPQHISADIDPEDNVLTKNIQVTILGGKWRNSDGISVQILDKIKDLIAKPDFHLSMNQIVSSIESWNGIADGVSIGEVWVSDTNDDEGKDIVITKGAIIVNGRASSVILGHTVNYDENGNECDIEGGARGQLFAHSRITLVQDNLLKYSSAVQAQTITHEVGHALGLRHPDCNTIAIMQPNTTLAAYVVCPHDEQALIGAYE